MRASVKLFVPRAVVRAISLMYQSLRPLSRPPFLCLDQTVFLDTAALPKDVRSAVLIVNNYAGAGFQHVSACVQQFGYPFLRER